MRGSGPSTNGGPAGIHQLVEAQVETTPNGIAVVSATERITYRELGRRANALARELVDRGVGRDDRVGLLATRSVDMVVGVLGILGAGAAYVPLDPGYPEARLSFMVSDCGMSLLVVPRADRARRDDVGITGAGSVDVLEIPRKGSAKRPNVTVAPNDLAYVIYTSGSTGRPKGVLIEHAGLVSLMSFTQSQMALDGTDRVLQFASFSFDASIWEIFAALTSGATLVLGDRDSLLPGPSLHQLMRESGVTIALLSPSVLRVLPPDGLEALRILVAGTEKLTADLVKRWAPGRRFFNAYGPTETTIYSTILELELESLGDEAPSIGRAVPGTHVAILDARLTPVPDGEPGELAISGAGVGRGYWRREALTRERFVVAGGRRQYLTGDQARLLPDGNIEYLGRRDFQVKVRGFRVELPEIEATIERHPEVGSAAVLDDRDVRGQAFLRAFYVRREASKIACTASELRRFVSGQLPDYMVPSTFVALERWPLSPNGKLDRSALAAQVRGGAEEPLPGGAEGIVLGHVREVLGDGTIHPDDNLIEAGLHSLAVAELVSRIEASFGARLKYSEVFLAGTPSGLATRLLASSSPAPQSVVPVAPADDDEIPLSFPQEGVWFLERRHPECRAYRFQATFDIKGTLDVEALRESLNRIVARHEILRTSFPARDGHPVQLVHPFEEIALPVETGPPDVERVFAAPFDVAELPLIRWRLFRLGPQRHILLHQEHHLLHDGWSYGVFLEELGTLYRALRAGESPELAPPSLQYREFARRQRQPQRHENGRQLDEAGLEYWKHELAHAPTPASLPLDFPRPAEKRFRGAQLRAPLDARLYQRLKAAAIGEAVTAYTWLHAVFQTFLHRFTGATDVTVGTGFANRGEPGLERMLGMVIQTSVIRGDFSGAPTFRQVLARLRAAILGAADHQSVGFDAVVRALNPERAKTDAPLLFNTFFDSYDKPFPDLAAPGLEVERTDGVSNGSSKFDLVALVVPRTGGTHAVDSATVLWEYDTDLFRPETAQGMLSSYLSLLDASLDAPDTPVGQLPVGGRSNRDRRLAAGRGRAYEPKTSLPELFAEVCARHPSATAIISGDGHGDGHGDVEHRLTYRELDARANRLANSLIRMGVQRGELVGVHLDRGLPAIVAMLACLKTGAGYVPVDPSDPPTRTARVFAETEPRVVVSDAAIDGYHGAVAAADAGDDPSTPAVSTSPDDLAYVMYTSGSTGEPKGVAVPHRAVARLVQDPDYVRLEPGERILQLAPLSFDASTFEIWGSLLNGGTLVVHPGPVPTAEELSAFVQRHDITTVWLTAPLFELVSETPLRVRQLIAGGDVLSRSHVRRYLDDGGAERDVVLVNGYGPTENTTFTCCHVMTRESELGRTVPIGRPIRGTWAYVLDESMEPLGEGVPGELYTGGHGLAWGYWSRPERTAEAFLPDPFATEPGARLYRTGDYCRWLPGGVLEFLGRRDEQVKLRGFRVELGEVEATLAALDGVSRVAAAVEADALVAYVVGDADRDAVLAGAARALPDHMVPSRVVFIEALPLSRNGKLDRARLSRQPSRVEVEATEHVGPRSDREREITSLWSALLNRERVGIHDNFFELGGHSLLASRIASRLQIPLATLFRFPTVAELAEAIETIRGHDVLAPVSREEGEL